MLKLLIKLNIKEILLLENGEYAFHSYSVYLTQKGPLAGVKKEMVQTPLVSKRTL